MSTVISIKEGVLNLVKVQDLHYDKFMVKPYYKYKKIAYMNISRMIKRLLRESGYFARTGLSESVEVTFGSSAELPNTIDFYIRDSWVLTISDSQINGLQQYNIRKELSEKESELLSKNLVALFKHSSDKSIPDFLDVPIQDWVVNKEFCAFTYNGFLYLNKD